ncbi:hypothetical protein [Shewanella maritima]|uniref:hypothetical protein n=1 Tax=Shewanella maritima TaxID=2520507 RepID=UPI0037360940
MGLADLKKNVSSCNHNFQREMSVHEFIEAANLYAAGKATPISNNNDKITPIHAHPKHKACMSLVESKCENQQAISKLLNTHSSLTSQQIQKKPFRRATFTLSEMAISQLQTLSQSSKTAKSKLIRQLINQHFALTPSQRSNINAELDID